MVELPDSILSDIEPGAFHFIFLSRTKRDQYNPDMELWLKSKGFKLTVQRDKGKADGRCHCQTPRLGELPGYEPCHFEEGFQISRTGNASTPGEPRSKVVPEIYILPL